MEEVAADFNPFVGQQLRGLCLHGFIGQNKAGNEPKPENRKRDVRQIGEQEVVDVGVHGCLFCNVLNQNLLLATRPAGRHSLASIL